MDTTSGNGPPKANLSDGVKTARQIYTEYKIMPALQLHQLRVAAVAKLIADNFQNPANTKDVVLAGLFHDMGNIIKSDLVTFPEFLEPEGIDYWAHVKKDFIEKYGKDAHTANVLIAREIGLPNAVVKLLDGVGFSRLTSILASDSCELKICEYADTRVGPYGVLSIEERLAEARARYVAGYKRKQYYETSEDFEKLSRAARELEKQISASAKIVPDNITDAVITNAIEELREYPVS